MSESLIDKLEPYFKIAETEAHKSPCIRRKYGSVIIEAGPQINHVTAHNARISNCCGSDHCIRDRMQVSHGASVEIGGEIHSEVAALVRFRGNPKKSSFVLVGFQDNKPIYDPKPCPACAYALVFAGFRHIYTKSDRDSINVLNLHELIERYVQQWNPTTT